jgi:hypothetical protein
MKTITGIMLSLTWLLTAAIANAAEPVEAWKEALLPVGTQCALVLQSLTIARNTLRNITYDHRPDCVNYAAMAMLSAPMAMEETTEDTILLVRTKVLKDPVGLKQLEDISREIRDVQYLNTQLQTRVVEKNERLSVEAVTDHLTKLEAKLKKAVELSGYVIPKPEW